MPDSRKVFLENNRKRALKTVQNNFFRQNWREATNFGGRSNEQYNTS